MTRCKNCGHLIQLRLVAGQYTWKHAATGAFGCKPETALDRKNFPEYPMAEPYDNLTD